MDKNIIDVIMIGAGPSSLTSAIYTTREDINTVLYEKSVVGGLAAITDKIDNYPGFPEGIEGFVLAEKLEAQAKKFGTKIEYGDVSEIIDEGQDKIVVVDGVKKKTRSILIATGSSYVKINVPGELEYYGKGVHYCATCDGAFYKNKRIAVIGGGNSAIQEAIFLTRFTDHIDLLVRSSIKASDVLQKELQEYVDKSKITVHLQAQTKEIVGENGRVCGVVIEQDGQEKTINVDGVFVFAGLKPNTDFLVNSGIKLDERGFIVTDEKMQTNIPGIFASGDVRSGATMQIACAVGEGAEAAHSIRDYLHNNK